MGKINYWSKITINNGSPKASNQNPPNKRHNNLELVTELYIFSLVLEYSSFSLRENPENHK